MHVYIQLLHVITVQGVTGKTCMGKPDKRSRAACNQWSVCVRRDARTLRERQRGGGDDSDEGDQAPGTAGEETVMRY